MKHFDICIIFRIKWFVYQKFRVVSFAYNKRGNKKDTAADKTGRQAQQQNILNALQANYLNQQNYPYKQMGFMSDILRGAPLTTTGSTVYQAAPSMMQNLTSLGLGAYGLSSLFGGTGTGQAAKAAGGSVKGYAGGGSVTSREFKEYAVGYDLPLSKRSDVYAALGRTSVTGKTDGQTFGVGLRHRF